MLPRPTAPARRAPRSSTPATPCRRGETETGRREWLARVILAACIPASARADAPTISAVLDVPRQEVATGPIDRVIHGDGHSHRVVVSGAQREELWTRGQVVVRSHAGGLDGHRHWVRVRALTGR